MKAAARNPWKAIAIVLALLLAGALIGLALIASDAMELGWSLF